MLFENGSLPKLVEGHSTDFSTTTVKAVFSSHSPWINVVHGPIVIGVYRKRVEDLHLGEVVLHNDRGTGVPHFRQMKW